MRVRRGKGEYRALTRAYLETYLETASRKSARVAVVTATVLAFVGAASIFVVVRVIFGAMSPAALGDGHSLRGFWLAPLALLFPAAPAAAALVTRRNQKWRWACWSLLPAMSALPIGGYASAGAYALSAAVALPPPDWSSAKKRLIPLALIAAAGAVASTFEWTGVVVAASLAAFVAVAATDGWDRLGLRAIVRTGGVIVSCISLGVALEILSDRLLVPAAPSGSDLIPAELRVCADEVTRSCAEDAAERAGFTIAWLPASDSVDPSALYAMGRRGDPVDYVLEEASGRRGELISIYSRSTAEPRATPIHRRIDGLDVTLWIEESGGLDSIEATWVRSEQSYRLSYLGHPLVERSNTELLDVASELIERMRYVSSQ